MGNGNANGDGPIEIVLTGGPCAGKSSSLRYLVEHLTARGWRVLVVPEAATMMITGGVQDIAALAAEDRAGYLAVQRTLVRLQYGLGEEFRALGSALGNPRTLLLHDRGMLDNRAYMDAEEYAQVLHETLGLTPGEAAARYDAVLHLITAADGAPDHYTVTNNNARFETVEQAVELDRAVQNAWLGHPNLTVIGNEGSFDRKLARVLAAVLNIVGEPVPVEVERKWLLAKPPSAEVLAGAVPVDIEQVYLPTDTTGRERRVRARTHDGHTTYFYTVKEPATDRPGRVEHESVISPETFRMLARVPQPGTHVVRKRRYCFVHAGQHFELDHLIEPVDVWLLEAELVHAADVVQLPPTLDVAWEVTNDPAWGNRSLSTGVRG